MIFPEDYIDGDKFESLQSESILYYDIENVKFDDIGRDYTLITHNSDLSPQKKELPPHIKKWYSQNLDYSAPNIHCIPIGLERGRWHPEKLGLMKNINVNQKRIVRALGHFNPQTCMGERIELARLCDDNVIPGDFQWTLNGRGFNDYITFLSTYAFCLCPRGNGIDTHRIWEALYMGCIPIVKRCTTYEYLQGLPVLFVDDWHDISYKRLEDFLSKAYYFGYNNIDITKLEKMKFSYWKNKIINGE